MWDFLIGGMYLKISEPISLTGSAGGIPPPAPSMRKSLYWGFCFLGRMRKGEAVLLTLTLSLSSFNERAGKDS
jgi:hypothetical protein